MAVVMSACGGLGIIHRMCSVTEQVKMLVNAIFVPGTMPNRVGAAIGIGDDWNIRSRELIREGASLICLDVAHGHQVRVLDVSRHFFETYPDVPLIVGNIATAEAALYFGRGVPTEFHKRLILKIGVGSGALCSTRIKTGFGLPTFQSILDVRSALDEECDCSGITIVADGGMKNSGDLVKSIAAGADAVMVGSLIAGTDECPGDVLRIEDGSLVKVYRGSASYGAKKEFFGDADYIEGVETLVPLKGSVKKVLKGLEEGIRSGMTYCGANTLDELRSKATFVRITPAGYRESLPHGIL
jgi:IMP dehydrogenase